MGNVSAFQRLTPLAIDCRHSVAKDGSHIRIIRCQGQCHWGRQGLAICSNLELLNDEILFCFPAKSKDNRHSVSNCYLFLTAWKM
jgi:hypothetical protein